MLKLMFCAGTRHLDKALAVHQLLYTDSHTHWRHMCTLGSDAGYGEAFSMRGAQICQCATRKTAQHMRCELGLRPCPCLCIRKFVGRVSLCNAHG